MATSRFWPVLVLMLAGGTARAADLKGDTVLIQGPEARLTVDDLRQVLKTMPHDVQGTTLQLPERLRQLIDQTYLVKVAAQRARRLGLEQDPVLQAKVEHYRRNLLAGMAADRYVQENLPSDDVLLELAKEQYLGHPERYRTAEQVHARHLLLRVPPGGDEAQVRAHIESIRQQIASGRLSFEEAARQYSEDPGSAPQGGDLGFFDKRRMVDGFREAAFSLPVGRLSQPVRSPYGFHLIEVLEKKPSRTIPFDEVKDKLVEAERKKAAGELRTRFWVQLRDAPGNQVDQQAMDTIMKNPAILYGLKAMPKPPDK